MNVMKIITESAAGSFSAAVAFSGRLKGGEVVTLSGDLGTGKTVFAKGIAEGLGVTGTVTSPTFTVMNEYSGRLMLWHFDMYRINAREAENLGLTEYFGRKTGVCVVEWAENVAGILPPAIEVKILNLGGDRREITISDPNN